MVKSYFKTAADAPLPLRVQVKQKVRFEECDSLGIVWHGRYASFFEDARVVLGSQLGIGYMDFMKHGVLTPLKQMYHDYVRPLRFEEEFTIEGILCWSEAARMNTEYILRNMAGEVLTTGYAVQLMLNKDFEVLLTPPPFYLAFCERWKAGELHD